MIFFSPVFFFFLLLERSASLAGVESSALALADEDCPCWISFTCGGGGSGLPLSAGFNSLGSAGAVGFSSLGSGPDGTPVADGLAKGEPPDGVAAVDAVSLAGGWSAL